MSSRERPSLCFPVAQTVPGGRIYKYLTLLHAPLNHTTSQRHGEAGATVASILQFALDHPVSKKSSQNSTLQTGPRVQALH